MPERIYVGPKAAVRDALGEKIRAKIISDLDIGTINSVRSSAVYVFNGPLFPADLVALAEGPLSDPIVQDYTINRTFCESFDWMVEVGFLPGVTDNAGRTAKEAAVIALGRTFPESFSVHTGTQYFFFGNVSKKSIERIAEEILANTLIQTIKIFSKDEWLKVHTKDFPAPVVVDTHSAPLFREVDLIVDDKALAAISKNGMLALSLEEMKCIKAYFTDKKTADDRIAHGMPAGITNVELEVLAQTWSEHCKHKIFNADITYIEPGREPERITSLFKSFVQKTTVAGAADKGAADLCLSVFKDNAGVVKFDDTNAIVFKVETHNSPSALDPYGGALTGIVGVNRDPFGTGLGAALIANTDVFCFASPFFAGTVPPRILHPKRVLEGVREGVEHGGNKSGIPTVNGTHRVRRTISGQAAGLLRHPRAHARSTSADARLGEEGAAGRPHHHGRRQNRQGRHPRRDVLVASRCTKVARRPRCRSATRSRRNA